MLNDSSNLKSQFSSKINLESLSERSLPATLVNLPLPINDDVFQAAALGEELAALKELEQLGESIFSQLGPEAEGNLSGSGFDLADQGEVEHHHSSNEELQADFTNWLLTGEGEQPTSFGKTGSGAVQIGGGGNNPLGHITQSQEQVYEKDTITTSTTMDSDGRIQTTTTTTTEYDDGTTQETRIIVTPDGSSARTSAVTDENGDLIKFTANITIVEADGTTSSHALLRTPEKVHSTPGFEEASSHISSQFIQPNPTDDGIPTFTVLGFGGRPLTPGEFKSIGEAIMREETLSTGSNLLDEEQDPLQGLTHWGHESVVDPGESNLIIGLGQVSLSPISPDHPINPHPKPGSAAAEYDVLTGLGQVSLSPISPDHPINPHPTPGSEAGVIIIIGDSSVFSSETTDMFAYPPERPTGPVVQDFPSTSLGNTNSSSNSVEPFDISSTNPIAVTSDIGLSSVSDSFLPITNLAL